MSGQTSRAANTLPPSGSDVARELERRIVAGEWAPGRQLPSERQIAEGFGVSRPIVREALRGLRERGLLMVSAGRGSFVREVRPTDGGDPELLARRGAITARHLIVARSMLEGEAAALAAQERSASEVDRMRQILTAFAATSGVAAAAELDVAFHEAVAVASRNPVIQVMFGSIRNLTHGVVVRSLTDKTVRAAGVPLHEVVLDAIAARDPDRARAAMVEHIGAARRFYGPDLDTPLADVLDRRAEMAPNLHDLLRSASKSIQTPAQTSAESEQQP